MKAAVLESKGRIVLKEVPVPGIREDHALIKVKSCGICGTDKHAYRGDFMPHFPLILGHEFSGIIEKTGEHIKSFKNGDRVVVNPDMYCHKCDKCRMGSEKNCRNWESIGTTIDGAFAEYISVREDCLYHLPDDISFDEGSLIEIASCVYSGIRLIKEYFNKRVIVLGNGSVGSIYITSLLNLSPLVLDVLDISEEKLEHAKKLGADSVYNVSGVKGNYYDFIKKKYDIVIDCTGNLNVLQRGFSLMDRDAHFIFFGVAPSNGLIEISPYTIYEQSWKITGVYPDMRSFGTIIEMMEKKRLKFKSMISHRFELSDFLEAFDFFLNESNRKKVIIYNQ